MHNIIQNIIGETILKCSENNVKVNLSSNNFIKIKGYEVGGYFFGNKKNPKINKFGCALGLNKETWLPVFIHESCHMDQYIEDSKVWIDLFLKNGSDVANLFFKWIKGKELNPKYDVKDFAIKMSALEFDCEERTVEKLKTYGLQDLVNIEQYIQRANSYAYSYLYLPEIRRWWTTGNGPYGNKKIWSKAPKTFNVDKTMIPSELLETFKEYL